jgi:hypothetical protein
LKFFLKFFFFKNSFISFLDKSIYKNLSLQNSSILLFNKENPGQCFLQNSSHKNSFPFSESIFININKKEDFLLLEWNKLKIKKGKLKELFDLQILLAQNKEIYLKNDSQRNKSSLIRKEIRKKIWNLKESSLNCDHLNNNNNNNLMESSLPTNNNNSNNNLMESSSSTNNNLIESSLQNNNNSIKSTEKKRKPRGRIFPTTTTLKIDEDGHQGPLITSHVIQSFFNLKKIFWDWKFYFREIEIDFDAMKNFLSEFLPPIQDNNNNNNDIDSSLNNNNIIEESLEKKKTNKRKNKKNDSPKKKKK